MLGQTSFLSSDKSDAKLGTRDAHAICAKLTSNNIIRVGNTNFVNLTVKNLHHNPFDLFNPCLVVTLGPATS